MHYLDQKYALFGLFNTLQSVQLDLIIFREFWTLVHLFTRLTRWYRRQVCEAICCCW